MKVTVPVDEALADAHLPEAKADGSGVGVNYADQLLKPFKLTLADGRKMLLKRRGLKLTLTVGDQQGEAILRRLDHGPDVKAIFRKALETAAGGLSATVAFEPSAIVLELPEA
jgi:hypothetical protein